MAMGENVLDERLAAYALLRAGPHGFAFVPEKRDLQERKIS